MSVQNLSSAVSEKKSKDIEQTANNLNTPYLAPQGMSRASQLLPFLPFGITTLWAWSRDGRFPAPIKLSSTMTAWRNAEVLAWLNNQTTSTSSEV
ncbi:AlpA family phage regulatory protein [Psychrobacter frigidicola]|uniref:AlpA family phage regulatory protein n=1 Tax=Psychrobacter frigidicola TaxID=45611 RepID=A0A5C7A217_9GAMM|nr:AlpA family phage regulatory protein [Psychrobacter frigidicola]TXD96534.1 AlpA family phage regulatory protein [Psychrobacter frigidicola]